MKRRPAAVVPVGPVTEAEFRRVLELCRTALTPDDLAELERMAGGPLNEAIRENADRPWDVAARTQHALNDLYWLREQEVAPQLCHRQGWRWGMLR